jgi:hypothetical protein
MMPPVDVTTIPRGNPGIGYAAIVSGAPAPGNNPPGDPVGNMRTTCEFSHMAFDDPLVAPGIVGGSHLHMFFGNTGANANSTASSIANSGNSTCRGGILNRSAYWVPAIVDYRNGRVIKPGDWRTDGTPEWGIYYKTKYSQIPFPSYQPPPVGLRMIAGDSKATSPQNPYIGTYICVGTGASGPTIPACPVGSYITMRVVFPNCWDGRNLSAPDNQSHMAYAVGPAGGTCPSTHPVPLPEITLNIHWAVRAGDDTRYWRLSSDNYPAAPGNGGLSLHADWWDGWDPEVMRTQVRNCLQTAPKECGSGNLGDGRHLAYPGVYP